MQVEWDETKRRANFAKHGIDFDLAVLLFGGRPVVTHLSSYPGEVRWLTTGVIDDRFYTVVWTQRANAIRLISARGRAMEKNERIVRYTIDEIKEKPRRGEDQTDYARIDAMTEAEREASIDCDEEGEIDWSTLQVGLPQPKQQLTVRFDRDVVEWFKAQGSGYQTRMNAVLRSFVEAQKQRSAGAAPRR